MPETPPPVAPGLILWETVKTLVIVIALALIIRVFLVQPYIVDGSSMAPNYHTNDYLLVDKLTYHFRLPERGEVIVFHYPKNPAENYIKRIIGLPGETVVIKGDAVTIKNTAHPDGILLTEPYVNHDSLPAPFVADQALTLKADEYFVMGDNRHASSDSRFFGALPANLIIGRPILRLYPFNDVRVVAGALDPVASAK